MKYVYCWSCGQHLCIATHIFSKVFQVIRQAATICETKNNPLILSFSSFSFNLQVSNCFNKSKGSWWQQLLSKCSYTVYPGHFYFSLSLLPKVVVSKQTHKNRRVRSQIHWETPNTHLFSASISPILELRRIYVVLGVLKFTVSTRLRKRNTHM